jgi:hypothetical protein
MQLQLMPVGVGQFTEGVILAGARTGQDPLGRAAHAAILASALRLVATQLPTSRRLEIRRSVSVAADA